MLPLFACESDHGRSRVDPCDLDAPLGERLEQRAAPAADVEHRLGAELRHHVDCTAETVEYRTSPDQAETGSLR